MDSCRRTRLGQFLLAATLHASFALADYAWFPDHRQLHVRGGVDFYSTGTNYADDGFLDPLRFAGQPGDLSDTIFWLAPEWGLAPDWSMGAHLRFLNSGYTALGTGDLLASGLGLGDSRLNFKWRVSSEPLFTLETYVKFPTGTAAPSEPDEIVLGEGNVDLGAVLHFGYQSGGLYVSVSPGFLGRTGGYSPAFTADVAIQGFIHRAYAKAFLSSIFSFYADALPPSTVDAQTLPGSVGSYARLAASPTGVTAGGALGVLLSRKFRLEFGVSHAVWGLRFPSFTNFTVNLLGLFDLRTPDLRPKIREVPFESGSQGF